MSLIHWVHFQQNVWKLFWSFLFLMLFSSTTEQDWHLLSCIRKNFMRTLFFLLQTYEAIWAIGPIWTCQNRSIEERTMQKDCKEPSTGASRLDIDVLNTEVRCERFHSSNQHWSTCSIQEWAATNQIESLCTESWPGNSFWQATRWENTSVERQRL